MEDDLWWSIFGRLAAPIFFFLLGFARTSDRSGPLDLARRRPYPARKLDSRLDLGGTEHSLEFGTHPHCTSPCTSPCGTRRVGRLLPPRLRTFLAALPITSVIVDYGSEGWLWALFGLCQRIYVDGRTIVDVRGSAQNSAPPVRATENMALMRLLACIVAALAYVWQEQREYSFFSTISPFSFSASVFCPLVCVCSSAAQAPSNRQKS